LNVFSVVIPACNEETLISRCLDALLVDSQPGEFEIVVVCNGCTDNTADVARSFGERVHVVETSVPSKWQALNLGDRVATAFPRLYVDADVELSTESARRVARALEKGALAASPTLRLDVSASSPLVRSYQRIWELLPVIRTGLVGRGVYGVSAAGRRRFTEFPDVIADDYFVHSLFSDGERVVVADATSVVRSPHRLRDVIQRKTRSYAGMLEAQVKSERAEAAGTSSDWLTVVAKDRRRLIDVPAYMGVSLTARVLAWRKVTEGRSSEWNRDQSTRQSQG
jgi:glycosyltransferase involved in cell wall biosynthesis